MARTIMPSKTLTATHGEQSSWQLAIYSATPVSVLILGLFYYWFGVANRYDIFLYGHTAKGIPITQPFDVLTSSRYWMAGLVGSGIVMVFYTAVHLLLARLRKQYRAPAWWHVWVLCLPAVLVGVPVITMTVNSPTLPPLTGARLCCGNPCRPGARTTARRNRRTKTERATLVNA